ncbi:Marco-Like Protein [Manis pentadactyla]|nr:Marco-Like Protein [Manis pentadactyla]
MPGPAESDGICDVCDPVMAPRGGDEDHRPNPSSLPGWPPREGLGYFSEGCCSTPDCPMGGVMRRKRGEGCASPQRPGKYLPSVFRSNGRTSVRKRPPVLPYLSTDVQTAPPTANRARQVMEPPDLTGQSRAFSVSSTQPLKTSVFKLQEGPESALIVEGGNEANIQRGQKESTKPGDSNMQGRPGHPNQPGEPGDSSQPGGLQGNSGGSNEQGKPEVSNEQGKPGSSGQQGKPGLSRQQQRSRPFYNQQERKTVDNPLNHNLKEIQVE